jgi:hypothetical protein
MRFTRRGYGPAPDAPVLAPTPPVWPFGVGVLPSAGLEVEAPDEPGAGVVACVVVAVEPGDAPAEELAAAVE